jgi:hypothetical protein
MVDAATHALHATLSLPGRDLAVLAAWAAAALLAAVHLFRWEPEGLAVAGRRDGARVAQFDRSEPGRHLDGGDDNRQTTAGSPGSRTGPLGQA